ncbi:Uncharacterised protein [Prevotella denticola]|uniref:Uncharacterized protein n=1 Tax=Prevotella denticola TaxID=28129 RepID=A0A379ECA4_9BACT|nr:Uncharacterised protein [Prevotella denticola]
MAVFALAGAWMVWGYAGGWNEAPVKLHYMRRSENATC